MLNPKELKGEDADVIAERERVLAGKYQENCPLIMKNMRKVYPVGQKLACKDVTLAVEDGVTFGLLGPNG